MKLTLYYAPVACSLVPLISLYEAGADFEVRPVNMRKGEQMSLAKYRNRVAHHERMQQRPAVKMALEFEKQIQSEFAKAA